MTRLYNLRGAWVAPRAIVAGFARSWCDEYRVAYLSSRKPYVYIPQFAHHDHPDHALFSDLESQIGVSPKLALKERAALMGAFLAQKVLGNLEREKKLDFLAGELVTEFHKGIREIRVICPFPAIECETHNAFAPALCDAVAKWIRILCVQNNVSCTVFSDRTIQGNSTDKGEPIVNVVQNDRGSTSHPEPGREALVYSERITRLPVYAGRPGFDVLSVPVDDFIVSQGTLVGLLGYLAHRKARYTVPICGFALFPGSEYMERTPQVQRFLVTAIERAYLREQSEWMSRASFEAALVDFLVSRGLAGIECADKWARLSAIESMFIAGLLSDPNDSLLVQLYQSALHSLGASVEDAHGNSTSDIFMASPMSLKCAIRHLEEVQDTRRLLVDSDDPRLVSARKSGSVVVGTAL